MIDKNLAAYKIPYGMYIAIGGDPEREFTSIADIYTEINKIYASVGNRVDIEPLKVEFTTNGTKVFNEDAVTGYKPVEVSVNVDVGDVYEDGYNTGYGEGYTQGETNGYNTGYNNGLEVGTDEGYRNGAEDQKALLEEVTITSNGVYEKEDGYNKVTVALPTGFDFGVLGYDAELSVLLNKDTKDRIEYSKTILEKWDPNRTSTYNYFNNDKNLFYVPLLDTSKVIDTQNMFKGCYNLTAIPLLDTSKVTKMYGMFENCLALDAIPHFDTSKVTTMERAFYGCTNLTAIPHFDTSSVTSMNNMFYGCTSFTTIPHFDTSNVTDMKSILENCSNLTSVPQFNTSKVTNMYSLVYGCKVLTSLPLLDASSVINMGYAVGQCSALTDVGGFKNLGMQSSLSTSSMFSGCNNLTHDSIMNIINNLYDRASAGYSVVTLPLGSTNLKRISDEEKSIATNKGWTLS